MHGKQTELSATLEGSSSSSQRSASPKPPPIVLVQRAPEGTVRPALIQNGNDPVAYTESGQKV